MANEIADFNIKIEANTKALDDISKKVDKLTEKVEDSSKKIDDSTENTVKKVSNLAKQFAVFGSQLLLLKKLSNSVFSFTSEAEGISRLAQMANVSTNSIQDLGHALENYGGSASSASSTLAKLNKQMADLRVGKGGALAKVVMQYGLDTSARSPEDMLLNISKRMQGMGALQQVSFGRALGLDDATIMFLQQGVKGVREELEKAKDLRLFDKQDIENSIRLQRKWRELQGVLAQISGIFLRAIQPFVERVIEYASIISRKIKEHPEELKKISFIIAGIVSLLSPVSAIFTGIALALDDIITYLRGGESYTGDLVNKFDELLNKSRLLRAFWEAIKEVVTGVWNVFMKILNGIGGIIGALKVKFIDGGSWGDAWESFKASIDIPANIGINTLKKVDNFPLASVNNGTLRDSIINNTQESSKVINIGTVEVKTQNNDPIAVSEDFTNQIWANNFALGLKE